MKLFAGDVFLENGMVSIKGIVRIGVKAEPGQVATMLSVFLKEITEKLRTMKAPAAWTAGIYLELTDVPPIAEALVKFHADHFQIGNHKLMQWEEGRNGR